MRASILLALCLLSSPASAEPRGRVTAIQEACIVYSVVDGDTIRCDGERVRVWGVDCPELDAPGGRAAKAALEEILQAGGVNINYRSRDRYGRPVAIVSANAVIDAGALLIRRGVCREWCGYSHNAYRTCL